MNNFDHILEDFPLLQRKINSKPVIYLDSAATSLKPQPVIDAMVSYYSSYSANIHRGIYDLSEEATAAYDLARKKVCKFIGGNDEREIIFTRNTTEALNLVASTWARQLIHSSEDTIVTTTMEHHANFIPWQQLAKEKNVSFIAVPIDNQGIIEHKLLNQYITRTTKLFAFSAVSNVLGVIQDVSSIVREVRKISPDCCIVVDAAQAAPHMPMNVSEWGADFVAFSGHKMLGPTGIGVLWGKYAVLDLMLPYQFGGDMIKEVSIEKTVFAEAPQKFEAGTPAIAEAIGLGTAVDYLNQLGMDNIRAHEEEITSYALEAFKAIPDVTIYGPSDVRHRSGVISFTLHNIHPHDISQILNEDNICIRAGHHCAMPLHTHLGITATARASFYIYTTKKDIDILVKGLQKVTKKFQ